MVELRPVEREAVAILSRRGGEGTLAEALRMTFGVALPAIGRWEGTAELRFVRTAPHQLLALREGAGEGLFDSLDGALGAHAGVVDLADARAAVQVRGAGAREALARLLPLDLHPSAMPAGNAASTLAAHISVLVLKLDEGPSYELVCQRSVAGTLAHALGLSG